MNYYESVVYLFDFGSDAAVDNQGSTSGTWYGTEVDFDRYLEDFKFFGETAITGDTSNKLTINVYSTTGQIAGALAFNTGTDHTANTHTDGTPSSTASYRRIAAGVMYTVGCIATGSPSALHTNSKVVCQFSPVSYI
jgi:hypothetical protein